MASFIICPTRSFFNWIKTLDPVGLSTHRQNPVLTGKSLNKTHIWYSFFKKLVIFSSFVNKRSPSLIAKYKSFFLKNLRHSSDVTTTPYGSPPSRMSLNNSLAIFSVISLFFVEMMKNTRSFKKATDYAPWDCGRLK